MRKRIIIIHGWKESPNGQWLPWVGEKLRQLGWQVELPDMPGGESPKLTEWMAKLESLAPDKHTVLIGHSLGNALIMKYLERSETEIAGAVMVAAWDWLMEDVREFHQTFFETGFDYARILGKNVPLVMVNSTTDPWIDFERSKLLAEKIGAKFIPIEKAGHFMARDGYAEFPRLVEIVEELGNI